MDLAARFHIKPLGSHHDRTTFLCGESSLDAYLKTQASQGMKRDLAACYVLDRGDAIIIGYYMLSACAVELTSLPRAVAKTSGCYPIIPAMLIGEATTNPANPAPTQSWRSTVDDILKSTMYQAYGCCI